MLINFNLDNILILCYTITFLGVTYNVIIRYIALNNATMVSEIDTTRVNEGLPTDMSLTPEDFAADPELAEIFGITDTNTNLDIALESNEHFEQVQNQIANNNLPTISDIFNEDSLLSLYEEMCDYDYIETMINIVNYDYIGTIINFDYIEIMVNIIYYDYIGTIINFI
jgi:hypothetical protein